MKVRLGCGMTPGQILERVRSHYVERLRQAAADHASDGIITVVPEAALRDRAGELIRKGMPATPVRVDLVTLVNGEVKDMLVIETEEMPSFGPFALRWEETMPVRVGPFPWNACRVRIGVGSAGIEVLQILEWFERWFDTEEEKEGGEDGLHGVVHSLTGGEDRMRYVVDFGSAPIEAFEELLDALKAAGAESVDIGANSAGTLSSP